MSMNSGKNPTAPRCPSCGRLTDGYTEAKLDAKAALPKAGDASICAYCGALAVFTENIGLRLPTVDETASMMQDRTIRLLLKNFPAGGIG
jgi:hypothetical protein